jgi:hypothetical protein
MIKAIAGIVLVALLGAYYFSCLHCLWEKKPVGKWWCIYCWLEGRNKRNG